MLSVEEAQLSLDFFDRLKDIQTDALFLFDWMGKGLEPISMQVFGEHLLAVGLTTATP